MKLRTYLLVVAAAVSLLGIRMMSADDLPIASTAQATPSSPSVQLEIPEEAIRLRILANSDAPRDQWLKRQVRDAVLQEMESWAQQPENIGEARRLIKSRLPQFQAIADETVRRNGFDYPVRVDYGKVPFPTKLYGNRVYPAGEYEALRIVIGKGEGGNWWCVLFPPLCFIDMESGDALPAREGGRMTASAYAASAASSEKPLEVRFFLLDTLEKVFSGWKD
ncbi:MAG: stage II sporulation protein R [Planifilum fulgidum]